MFEDVKYDEVNDGQVLQIPRYKEKDTNVTRYQRVENSDLSLI
jgi:hypothetical protein